MAYFASTRRGEIAELQEELNSNKPDRKKEAVKKVIAAMTVGKDVSSLFPHVIKSMETTNIDLKKLVYLYIINYAKTQPDLAILAVNSFRKDARNPSNPLIRALAVRTMGCIRVEKITEYLCEPLKDALGDDDPYVRKTAAICVAKLYDISPYLVEDDFLQILDGLLSDGNAMVVANTVAALLEITDMKGKPAIRLNSNSISRILAALPECTEWGQVSILDYLVTYTPIDIPEAESIIERVVPRLAHSNAAVVISTVKVLMKYMDFVTNSELIRSLCRKLGPILVSLLGAENEMQYVALKCINLVVQKRGNILDRDIRVFFCKYNDPIYVKLEKLEIMVQLSDLKNIDQVLYELKEYATEVDVEFVRKSVRAIGRCAIKLERAVDRCISCLLDLISLKVNFVVQEAVIVIRDIFRKYPNRYEMIIKNLFENLENLDDPEAKASMIWILGEYSDRIDDATAQIAHFIETYMDEPPQVQLQLLTATVKLFLKKPDESEGLITDLLKQSTESASNPDLRDRAYIYWRLLSSDPEAAKDIIFGEKPTISDDTLALDATLLDRLIEDLGRLSTIYRKPAEAITNKKRERQIEKQEYEEEVLEYDSSGQRIGEAVATYSGDLLGIDAEPSKRFARIPLQNVLNAQTPGVNGNMGLSIDMAFQRINGEILLDCRFTNSSQALLSDWAMQFNVNHFGLAMGEALALPDLHPGASKNTKISIVTTGKPDSNPPGVPIIIQIAIKCSLDIYYFQIPCMYTVLLSESGLLSKEEFKQTWTGVSDPSEFTHTLQAIDPSYSTYQLIQDRLEANHIFFVAGKSTETGQVSYFSTKNSKDQVVLCEIRVSNPVSAVQVTCKTPHPALAPLFIQGINFLLSTAS
ncbi:unnamed protein product [Blepharisma stoltei]|uniref:Beta-adaptin appendage C-terminal subdomain domain-containing protein n=1 Tax=Blepharisma stoltei TaxID=1481888 RepID=A0AAU9JT46_9CILI|nr:unnamed protein product [Blepharisma stoltei]